MNTDAYTPEFTSSIPEEKTDDKISRWVLERAKRDARTYDRLVRIIRKKGIEIEDRPINNSSKDAAMIWPRYKSKGADNPIILRSQTSRSKKIPSILAHELGHIESASKPIPRVYQGLVVPWMGAGSMGLGLASGILRNRTLALIGAGLGGAHAISRFAMEADATRRAKRILSEITGREEKMPSNLGRALTTYGVSSIPALANLILLASRRA